MGELRLITGIIMASGFSRRIDSNKLVLDFKGKPIIERVIKAVKESDIDEIIMVYREDTIKEIGIRNNIKAIPNYKAELGQSQSIKIGVRNASKKTNGFMFFVGDQPLLNTITINKLIKVFKDGEYPIVVPNYNGKRGNPVIFSSSFKEELLNITGDHGGRSIIMKNQDKVEFVKFENEAIGKDIDTWKEYTKWKSI